MDIPGGAVVPVPANPAGTGGGPDSGVETEDQESNDSSLSNVSLGGPIQPPNLQEVQQAHSELKFPKKSIF